MYKKIWSYPVGATKMGDILQDSSYQLAFKESIIFKWWYITNIDDV